MDDTFTPEPDPEAVAPVPTDEETVDDASVDAGSESTGDHAATDAVDPTSVANPNDVADPTFATENQDDTSPAPVVVGAGGQHEASDPVNVATDEGSESVQLDGDGTPAATAETVDASGRPLPGDQLPSDEGSESDVDPTVGSQSEGNKIHKDPAEQDNLDGGGNPVHAPEVAQAGLAEHRPGVRGRPGIDD